MRSDHKLQKPPYIFTKTKYACTKRNKKKNETTIQKNREKQNNRTTNNIRLTRSNRFKSGKNDNFSYDDLTKGLRNLQTLQNMRNKSLEAKTFVVFKEERSFIGYITCCM